MNIFEHWQMQKELLRAKLYEQTDMAGAVYQVRHALLQTEQNALAELEDDVLRQQMGVLFGTLKTSVGLMEAHILSQIRPAPKASARPRENRLLLMIAAGLLLLLTALCAWDGAWLEASLAACSLILAGVSMLCRPKTDDDGGEVRVSLRPDIDRLFIILDGQLRSLDRVMNDFIYLNAQLRRGSDGTDPSSVARAADLMESLYACEAQGLAEAHEAAEKLLASMGLCAIPYSAENSRSFNILPSKQTTRTLSPAILSMQDHRLLRRGTAAVCMDAAQTQVTA